ncbi:MULTISPECIES: hypothetical protein [unclassified Variovorax]|uniref:hypothetical protein n=1 Tax=unclassified Variovorax TaxID=663243 RepID=UPI0008391A88|nr:MULTISPECIES: hypothetical protein [unclassified Variovorax]PNG50102.1 hypothetical protein CHC06_05725 [Variovorax sp. B2]PNG50974.1 hypothetical protein CHC07_05630 [Variovorax sp. B4]VTV17136.1 hypothetical protein WDL1P1_00139 [Variovorax sp. WDL1]
MPQPYTPTTKDGRAVADENELRILKALRHFGHLRRQEVASAVWPRSSGTSAYVMAGRTVKRMLSKGMLLEKANTLGGYSLVLASKGVARLKDFDIVAQEGYELAFNGPQFFHRTLGTNYLIERARAGDEIFGEYALLKGWSPVDKEYVRERFRKIPDGLIVYSGATAGFTDGTRVADWVEVESAFKPYEEVKKALELLTRDSQLTKSGGLLLNKLVFVYDSRHKHDKQLLRYIAKFLKEYPGLTPELVLAEIILARCFVDVPFSWHGVEETTALDLMRAAGDLDTDSLDAPAADTAPSQPDL